jgi:hypothetical protein
MSSRRTVPLLVLVGGLLMGSVALGGQKEALEQAATYDGLQPVNISGLDLAYAKPGATLAGYSRVMIAPVSVAFDKSWEAKAPGSPYRMSTSEIERIRSDVAKIVSDAFTKELKRGGYTIVTEAGPETLLVRPAIIGLYVNAPDVMRAGRSRTYTASAGQMTLVAELIDSETGAVVARVLDRQQARETAPFTISSRVTNTSAAEIAAQSWARILRTSLDKAKEIGKN